MPTCHRAGSIAAASFMILALGGCSGSDLKKGRAFESEGAFRDAATASGYVVIGSFNTGWPATISSVAEGKDGIAIDVPGHTRQEYSGFTGYRLKAVVLERTEGGHSGFVLRSEEK